MVNATLFTIKRTDVHLASNVITEVFLFAVIYSSAEAHCQQGASAENEINYPNEPILPRQWG